MAKIRVLVHGAAGRMGQEVVRAVLSEPDMALAGGVDIKKTVLTAPDGTVLPFSTDLAGAIKDYSPDVMVDFTNAKASVPAVRLAAKAGVNLVIGTTGFTQDELGEIRKLAEENRIGVVVAANFALGAVLMIHLARIAAKFMDHAEIIELHHDRKLDAPSGTSLTTARAMLEARGKPFLPPAAGEHTISRGQAVEGISIHSVRLPGLMAHQEVIFGAAGQTLSIRHDTITRECYMPGVVLAIRTVVKQQGFIYGLDRLLGL
ncbi:MAG: 4-hydroxy-tetrahydrodipicolinate reductase [Dehalococcoidales bacterium]|nr:4-hydroxy-tetrahydrodipicolinate reductase [Dehalococcoidales bacterium]